MAKYVDGFVIVIPKDKTQAYKDMAALGRDSWMKHGALSYFECRRDELKPQEMGEMDEQMKDQGDMEMPFSMTQMSYGGFQVEVEG